MAVSYAYPTTLTLDVEYCYKCGVAFGLEREFRNQHLRHPSDNAWSFYCPNGHGQVYTSETEEARLKRELKAARDSLAAANAERDQIEASRRAFKGQATRLRNRTIAGQCPICGQSLHDLARHIRRVHPDEQPEVEA